MRVDGSWQIGSIIILDIIAIDICIALGALCFWKLEFQCNAWLRDSALVQVGIPD
jgi:hypothetical protein